jgi:2-oxoglutarate ferredoxin oxidoreductase subunit gamma
MSAARLEVRMAGSGGQGLITGMAILLRAFALAGRRAAQSQSYEPTSRGGFCYSDLVVTEDANDYPLAIGLDAMAALSPTGLERSLATVKPGGLVLIDARMTPSEGVRALPFAQSATALGNPRVANVVALGALCSLAKLCAPDVLEEAVRLECPPRFIGLNLDAVREGMRFAT